MWIAQDWARDKWDRYLEERNVREREIWFGVAATGKNKRKEGVAPQGVNYNLTRIAKYRSQSGMDE